MPKGIVPMLVATPVCAALAILIAALSVHIQMTGEPFTGEDFAMALVFGLISLAVVSPSLSARLTGRSIVRNRESLANDE